MIRIYAQGPDEVMNAADRIVLNMLYKPEVKAKKWLKPALLDNGGLQGSPVYGKKLIDSVKRLSPELVIAPDIFGNSSATFDLHKDYSEIAKTKIMNKSIGVLRPELQNFNKTLNEYQNMGFNWIGLPSREYIVRSPRLISKIKQKGFKVHILGAKAGTWDLVCKVYYDSIDFVTQTKKEFEFIKDKINTWSCLYET